MENLEGEQKAKLQNMLKVNPLIFTIFRLKKKKKARKMYFSFICFDGIVQEINHICESTLFHLIFQ